MLSRGYSSATPFCSSYLSIPTITSTATATSSVYTTTTITTTHGTDTLTAPVVTVTASAAQVSTACSCLSIATLSTAATNTITVTPTATGVVSVAVATTVTPFTTNTVTSTATDIVCLTPTQFSNQDIQWAEYRNNQGNNNDNTYSNLNPKIYKNQSPNIDGVTSTVGGISASGSQYITVCGSSESFASDYFALDHKGYLFAVVTATYTFTVSGVDDAAFLWLGPSAYSGWTRANANLVVVYNGDKAVAAPPLTWSQAIMTPSVSCSLRAREMPSSS
ncbi:hypothetical protein BJ170DRAFT_595550 [Xylariales sp. AK1849]|nr:hypothetical protein BJ170DRAFT_595550 [Xylariales sp. AK1849]